MNGTLNNGVYALNGNNSWVLEGTSVSGGPVDQNTGRNGDVYGGWFHLEPGANLAIQRTQSIGFSITYWPIS